MAAKIRFRKSGEPIWRDTGIDDPTTGRRIYVALDHAEVAFRLRRGNTINLLDFLKAYEYAKSEGWVDTGKVERGQRVFARLVPARGSDPGRIEFKHVGRGKMADVLLPAGIAYDRAQRLAGDVRAAAKGRKRQVRRGVLGIK